MRLDKPDNFAELIDELIDEFMEDGMDRGTAEDLAMDELVADGVVLVLPD